MTQSQAGRNQRDDRMERVRDEFDLAMQRELSLLAAEREDRATRLGISGRFGSVNHISRRAR